MPNSSLCNIKKFKRKPQSLAIRKFLWSKYTREIGKYLGPIESESDSS